MTTDFQFTHGTTVIHYRLTAGRSTRGVVSLKIRADGVVLASVPPRVPASAVHRLVREKAEWIAGHLATLATRPATAPAPGLRYADGENHWFLGERYPLRLLPHPQARDAVRLAGPEIHLFSQNHHPDRAFQALYRWYAVELEARIRADIGELTAHMPWVTATPPFRLKLIRSRWGSCSGRGNLNFNLHLAKAPPQAIRYVVLHELCHLAEMNHSARFWRLVTERMPDWPRQRDWFKAHGAQLMVM